MCLPWGSWANFQLKIYVDLKTLNFPGFGGWLSRFAHAFLHLCMTILGQFQISLLAGVFFVISVSFVGIIMAENL